MKKKLVLILNANVSEAMEIIDLLEQNGYMPTASGWADKEKLLKIIEVLREKKN